MAARFCDNTHEVIRCVFLLNTFSHPLMNLKKTLGYIP